MPWSEEAGVEQAQGWLVPEPIHTVLDVGPGAAFWPRRLGPVLDGAEWDAVEVWGPYVQRFQLRFTYRTVVVADVAYLDWSRLPEPLGGRAYDLVVLGDVLEHLRDLREVDRVLAEAKRWSRRVLLAGPVGVWPQGPQLGNPRGAHLVALDEGWWSSVASDARHHTWSPDRRHCTALLEVEPSTASWTDADGRAPGPR